MIKKALVSFLLAVWSAGLIPAIRIAIARQSPQRSDAFALSIENKSQ